MDYMTDTASLVRWPPNAVFDYLKGFTFANNSDPTTVFVNSGVS
jgi:hypothetical protein